MALLWACTPRAADATPDEAPARFEAEPLVSGASTVVTVPSAAGAIAVRVSVPSEPRYAEGAPPLVVVPPFFTPERGFARAPDADELGFVVLTPLWPGRGDPKSGAASTGSDDYGGPLARQALASVLRYASDAQADASGSTLSQRLTMALLADELGVYAFSHPGMVATRTFAEHGGTIPGLSWFLGHENPTSDALCAVELGHWGEDRQARLNEAYRGYDPVSLDVDYSSVGWDGARDVPVIGGHVLSDKVPRMFGKRVWSTALTRALRDAGALSEEDWPEDVATVAEAEAWWAERTSVGAYADLGRAVPQLKTMLLFGARGHVQSVPDLPQIHQAWDGLRGTAGLWVRLNPDTAYVRAAAPQRRPGRELPANTPPSDWSEATTWGHPPGPGSTILHARAALAELGDRAHADDWRPDLDAVLDVVPVSSSAPAEATPPALAEVLPEAAGTGPGALQIVFAARMDGRGGCTKADTRGCSLYLAYLDASGVITEARVLSHRPGVAQDFPVIDPEGRFVVYQERERGPPRVAWVDLTGDAGGTLLEGADHPALADGGSTLLSAAVSRSASSRSFDLQQTELRWTAGGLVAGETVALTSTGRVTEPVPFPDGSRMAWYEKGGGRGQGTTYIGDRSGGEGVSFGPKGCAHGGVAPDGSLFFCQRFGSYSVAELGAGRPAPSTLRFDLPLDGACERTTVGHTEFCGGSAWLLSTVSCWQGDEIVNAEIVLHDWQGGVVARVSSDAGARLGARDIQARSGTCRATR